MNCYRHVDRAAVGVCVNCGAGVCTECVKKTATKKNACSDECVASSSATDGVLNTLAARIRRSSKATAWFCWSLGTIFGILGLFSLSKDLFFAIYLLAPCVVFVFVGFWYNSIGRKAV